MKRLVLISIALFLSLTFLDAKIKLPALIADNMVLQQNSKVKLWGEAISSHSVSILTSWDMKKYIIQSGVEGKWQTTIQTPTAGGPYKITITDKEPLVVENVLIGEVWFCSGQSNMDMPISGYFGQPVTAATDAIAESSENDNIRFFKVERAYNNTEKDECNGLWNKTSPATTRDCSAVSYFFAQYLQKVLKVPVGIITSTWGGSRIEAWMDKETLGQFKEISLEILQKDIKEIKNPRPHPALIYNAMVYPVMNYAIKGILWYQGEANRNEPDMYCKLFPEMVSSWRNKWRCEDLPFYYVQIAPHNYSHPDSLEAANLRQAQLDCLAKIPNSGMISTGDIGSPECIHPPQKDVVGKRLALLALAKSYNRSGTPYSGPLYKSAIISNDNVILNFQYTERGLNTSSTDITGFELAGIDKNFYPAKAILINENTQVQLTCDKVKDTAYVRFAYKNYAPVNLFNNWGLPAFPFVAKLK